MKYRIENLIDKEAVEKRIKELAREIEKDYAGEELYWKSSPKFNIY